MTGKSASGDINTEWITRPLSGLLLAALVLGAIGYAPSTFAVLVAAVSVLAAREWHRLVRTIALPRAPFFRDPAHFPMVGTAVAILLGVMAILHHLPLLAAVFLVLGAGIVFIITRIQDDNALWQGAGVFYIGVPALCLTALRTFPEHNAALIVMGLFVIIWATDTGALLVGRLVGGAKLAPAISPGKTWAGTIGGSLTAGIAYAGYILLIGGPFWAAFAFATIFSVIAHGGDLFESFVKRRFGAKDSGRMIPGHGGVLDRVDSTFAAAPVMTALVFILHFNPLMWGAL